MELEHSKTRIQLGSVPLGPLPEDLIGYLERARVKFDASLRLRPRELELVEELTKRAKTASRQSATEDPALQDLQELSDANAMMVVAMSSDRLTSFPAEMALDSLVPLANLCGSVAREHEAAGDGEAALERYILGLNLLATLQLHRPWYKVDRIAYWLVSRASLAVGRVAAERGLPIGETIRVFESNFDRFASLLSSDGLRAPRAFAVLSLVRRTLTAGANAEGIGRMRDDLIAFVSNEDQISGPAGQRFRREAEAILSQIDLFATEPSERRFRWS